MKEAGYNLVIEPITWLHISTGSAYESYKTYGSYYNIARKWVSKGGKDSGSFYNSYMGSLGNNCLVVSRESKSMDGSKEIKPITSAVHRKISETVSLIEAGYGLSMHMYSSDFDESGTHTYDPILGTLPGPAPDPSDLPQDSPDKGGNTITIIKNYVTETNGTEQTDGNYTRVKNPHTIEIEDEPNYKVVEWNTSTKEAPSIPDGSKTPWSTLIQTSTKTNTGTTPTTVELSNKEKVMYKNIWILFKLLNLFRCILLHISSCRCFYYISSTRENPSILCPLVGILSPFYVSILQEPFFLSCPLYRVYFTLLSVFFPCILLFSLPDCVKLMTDFFIYFFHP